MNNRLSPLKKSKTVKENWIPAKTDEMLLAQFNNKYVLGFEDGVESTKTVLKTWFNPEAFHSVASGVFFSHQFVLHHALDDSYTIKASNHPLPPNNTEALTKNVNYMIQVRTFLIFHDFIEAFLMFRVQ